MPDLLEHMYCSQQINIPPNLPYILKQYAKAAIRTQPYDLLYWSAAYFRAKANNTPPPVKDRLEYPPFDSPSRLSPGFLKVLHKQLGENETIPAQVLYDRWLGVCLVKEALDSMLEIGHLNATNHIFWLKFVAVAAGHLSSSLKKSMVLICEVITNEPEGGSAMIPVEMFVNLYQFLARLDYGPETPKYVVSSEHTESSIASESTNASCSAMKVTTGGKTVEEKDSAAGLMVWDDLKPEEKVERISTPKYTEELGASSELGIEVLDDATGPVKETITIFSGKSTISAKSIPYLHTTYPSIVTNFESEDGELSHTSLKENTNWLEIEPKAIQENTESSEDLAVPTGSSNDVDLPPSKSSEEDNVSKVEQELSTKPEERVEAIEEIETVELPLEETVDEEKSEGSQNKKDINSTENNSDDNVLEEKPSQDSGFDVSEKITKHFINEEIRQSPGTYSSLEIRKGYVGDESEDRIESSENSLKPTETVIQMQLTEEESSERFSQEEIAEKSQESKSERSSSSKHSDTSKTYKRYIPGIGPMIPEPQILAVVEYMQFWGAKQHGYVMPRNINHLLCPPLDLPPASEQNITTKQ